MTDLAMWRVWGTARYTLTRLPRYWLALLGCHRHGHQWNARNFSGGKRGCTRCWKWESDDSNTTTSEDR